MRWFNQFIEHLKLGGELNDKMRLLEYEKMRRSVQRWDKYHYEAAVQAASQSKDETQVGAVLVAPDDRARFLTAYNGPPMGVHDTEERRQRPKKYFFVQHAERNLISIAAAHGIRTAGCTVFTTHSPCAACAGAMINAGIVCVVAGPGKTSMDPAEFANALVMLREANVKYRIYDEQS